jgi:hypothetical protein
VAVIKVREEPRDELMCSECGRVPREDENAEDEWRVGLEGTGWPVTFCPECWEREFGELLARLAALTPSRPSAGPSSVK